MKKKRLFLGLAVASLLLSAWSANAAWLVCDPYLSTGWQPQDFIYQIQTGTDGTGQPIWGTEQVTSAVNCPEVSGSVWMHLNIDAWPTGTTTLHVKARKIIPPLQLEESVYSVPFTLSKTSTGKVPSGFGFRE